MRHGLIELRLGEAPAFVLSPSGRAATLAQQSAHLAAPAAEAHGPDFIITGLTVFALACSSATTLCGG